MGDETGAERIRESAVLGSRMGLDEHAARAWNNLSFFLVEQRRCTEAADALDEGMRFTADRDLDLFHLYSLGTRARLRVMRGQWTAAWDDAAAVVHAGPTPLNSIWPLLVRGVLGVRRGDPDPVDNLDHAWEIAVGFRDAYRLAPIAAATAEYAWLTGVAVRGVSRLSQVAQDLCGRVSPWQAGEVATWLARLGRDIPAGLDASGTPYQAQLAGDPAAAAAEWGLLGMPYERAVALVDSDTEPALIEALEICYELGATTTAGWIRRSLRDHGVASPPRGPRSATRANPAGLTARQVDVLRALTAGLTNAEIAERLYISEKTAGHHVSAILTKLGVPSRRDAARLAAELGVAG